MSQNNGNTSHAKSSSSDELEQDFWLNVCFLATLPVPHIRKALVESVSDAWKHFAAQQMPFANEEWFPSSMRVPRDLYPTERVGGGLHGPPQTLTHYLEDEYFTVYCGRFRRVVWEDPRLHRYTWPNCEFGYDWLLNVVKCLTEDLCYPEYPDDEAVARLPIPAILKDLHRIQDFQEPWFTQCCEDYCMWRQPHNFAHPDHDHLYVGCEEEEDPDWYPAE